MRKVALLLFLVVAPLAAQYSPPGGAGGSGIAGAPSTWPSTFPPVNTGDWAGTWQTHAASYFQSAIPGTLDGQVLVWNGSLGQWRAGGVDWGLIGGTLSAQTDLWGVLSGKVGTSDSRLTDARTPLSHVHLIADVTGLQVALDAKAAAGHNHTGVYEPANANIQAHISSLTNPHAVTAAQLGLSNVNNTSDANKPISTAESAALAGKQPTLTLTTAGTSGAATLAGGALNIPQYGGGGSMTYPGVGVPNSTGAAWGTSYAVGTGAGNLILGNDARLSDARTPVNTGDWAGTWQTHAASYFQSAIPGAPGSWPTFATVATSGAYASLSGLPTIPSTPAGVGLGNVDNTSDASKPISTATATALAGKVASIALNTATLGTVAIAANSCATTVTVAGAGIIPTDVITWTPNADISAVVGYGVASTDGLIIYPYPTSGNVNFHVCNATGSSITPGAVTLNWRVAR